jgi:hypothetical protein
MTKQALKHPALALGLLGLALLPSTSLAQARLASKLAGKRPASVAAHAASHQTKAPGAPSYTYTLLSFPGTLSTAAIGINLGAITSKTAIIGAGGEDGFVALVSGKTKFTETYEAVNYPHAAQQVGPQGINDLGQIVGQYFDSAGHYHSYELSGGRFTTIEVPFTGATTTFAYGINNSEEIVGAWQDSGGNIHGFTLIAGSYTSFDFPGASATQAFSVNSAGDIVGPYTDASNIAHGFLLSGGTYTAIDFPGSTASITEGINDSGVIVGDYCTTSECAASADWTQSYQLSGAVFTSFEIPGEPNTILTNINNDGLLVGFYQDAAGLEVSFLANP